ncbi:MAG: CBS domain-containing protein [Planctomycetes bacterium]|nr:CBS domain-containing protein [Planctomycetota bacterium]
MSRFPTTIDKYMSSALVVISPAQPLSEAIRLMRLHDVRHLPVVKGKQFVGVISQRDIYLLQSLDASNPSQVAVAEAMTDDPYTVEPDEPVDRVARAMAQRKIGTAVVTHGERLLGLFTTSDALLALAALLEDEHVPGEEDVDPDLKVSTRRKRPTVAAKRRASPAKPSRTPAAARSKRLH